MTTVAGGKMQGGHVCVFSVPWEATRCSAPDCLSCPNPDEGSDKEKDLWEVL